MGKIQRSDPVYIGDCYVIKCVVIKISIYT